MHKQDKTPNFLRKWRISSVIATIMVVGMALELCINVVYGTKIKQRFLVPVSHL
jgi:hypothetical protein